MLIRATRTTDQQILVINCGSSSIKFAIFTGENLDCRTHGNVAEIGGNASLTIAGKTIEKPYSDHRVALAGIFEEIERSRLNIGALTAVVHRVVHGGPNLSKTVRITPNIEKEIERCGALAPLHNPHNLSGIRAVTQLDNELPQFACFDTAFHQTNPEVAQRFALPSSRETHGFRRYGFHGISYSGLVKHIRQNVEGPLPNRLLAMHLGNGASLCAIKEGCSVATTMGYSPLDGLTMGTRCGSIDATVVIELAERVGIEKCKNVLNQESGLLGLGRFSDMRSLSIAGTDEANFAIEHFCYWATRHAGSMIAAMAGCDAIAFTGGIGENDSYVRKSIIEGLGFVGARLDFEENQTGAERIDATGSALPIWIVKADEERSMAREAISAMD
jgi:acetate kinase